MSVYYFLCINKNILLTFRSFSAGIVFGLTSVVDDNGVPASAVKLNNIPWVTLIYFSWQLNVIFHLDLSHLGDYTVFPNCLSYQSYLTFEIKKEEFYATFSYVEPGKKSISFYTGFDISEAIIY